MPQKKNSFDDESKAKIKRSLWLSVIASVSTGALTFAGSQNIKLTLLAMLGAWGGFVKNTVDTYKEGIIDV